MRTNLSPSQEPPELAEAATLTTSVLKLYEPQPNYPVAARQMRFAGQVVVSTTLSPGK